MRYICPECGNEIPEDSEFCYSCGRKRDDTIRLDDEGKFVAPNANQCASCGNEISPNDLFCQHCGAPITRIQMAAFRPKMVKYGWIGIVLALIPGLFSIYGLGHLYFRRWSRAAIFLLTSAFMVYLRWGSNIEMNIWTTLLFGIMSIFLYLMQAMEVLVLAFMPPKTAE